jgi:hypothetical protein
MLLLEGPTKRLMHGRLVCTAPSANRITLLRLLVADDVGNTIWRVSSPGGPDDGDDD